MIPPPPPPAVADLPAGTQLVAGLGVATVLADMDFETYSEAGFIWNGENWECLPHASQGKKGLPVVGAARYSEHPSTEVLSLAYELKDGSGSQLWRPGDPLPQRLFDHLAAGGLIEAWNARFEYWIWTNVCVPRYEFPPLPVRQIRCAMAKARVHALPGALEKAGEVLGASTLKDKDGKRLLNKFSMPRNPTKTDQRLRIRPEDDQADADLLYQYNFKDIRAEAAVSAAVPDLSSDELDFWQLDQAINRRGVAVDMEAVTACVAIVEQALERYDAELCALTNGAVEAASQIQRLSAWLHVQGVHLDSLDEEHVTEALTWDIPPLARRALEIRAMVGSASVKKIFAIANQVTRSGRLHDLFTYHGARTSRTTGNGPQPTNLPNGGPEHSHCHCCKRPFGLSKLSCPWCGADAELHSKRQGWRADCVPDALTLLRTGLLDVVEVYFDNAMELISGCLRGVFVAAPQHDLICSDYHSIEAVVLAELAGETWRQEVFRDHGKIYEMSAALVTGIPFDDILEYREINGEHHPARKKGKVMELALGYGGWVGSLVAFGADEFMTEAEMADAAGKWRRASASIVELWGGQTRNWRPCLYGIEGCAVAAVANPGTTHEYRGLSFTMRGDVLYFKMLGGGLITYHRPRLTPTQRLGKPAWEMTLSFEGWNTNPKNGPVGWIRMETYGPKLVENATQKTARDIQWHGMRALERAGYPIVLHVYDEDVAEVPEGWGSVKEFEAIMCDLPEWAKGWPVRATGGWRGKRYRKD